MSNWHSLKVLVIAITFPLFTNFTLTSLTFILFLFSQIKIKRKNAFFHFRYSNNSVLINFISLIPMIKYIIYYC